MASNWTVKSQEPAAGTTADPVSTVTLAVTKPAETSAAAPSADCLPADKAAAAIKEGFTSGTTYTGKAFAVKSKDYANAYMVAMSASTPESNNDALVYVTPDLENPGPIHSADAVSALYANWPQAINAAEGTKFSAADHSVSESKACLK